MKPDFTTMNKKELKAYVLEHRDDLEAIRHLFSRRTQGEENKRFPPLCKDGIALRAKVRTFTISETLSGYTFDF